ncbi:hypothetical protein VTK73DRAFT_7897 [Phialemonium thermophilum]|uniref:Uncharacterized protein n=1 Tax=Phialemonium thermophilum TaxID=223376 RepID=A0ABR3WBT7_9PEZI
MEGRRGIIAVGEGYLLFRASSHTGRRHSGARPSWPHAPTLHFTDTGGRQLQATLALVGGPGCSGLSAEQQPALACHPCSCWFESEPVWADKTTKRLSPISSWDRIATPLPITRSPSLLIKVCLDLRHPVCPSLLSTPALFPHAVHLKAWPLSASSDQCPDTSAVDNPTVLQENEQLASFCRAISSIRLHELRRPAEKPCFVLGTPAPFCAISDSLLPIVAHIASALLLSCVCWHIFFSHQTASPSLREPKPHIALPRFLGTTITLPSPLQDAFFVAPCLQSPWSVDRGILISGHP